jgi:beta-lactamase regulating signal transducer with metallopeptidase domain/protocatechuate 3,4-dioxygenase beta subunit
MWTLVHTGWIGLLMGGVAALAGRVLRRGRPEQRYAVHFVALGLLGLSLPGVFVALGRNAPARPAPRTLSTPRRAIKPVTVRAAEAARTAIVLPAQPSGEKVVSAPATERQPPGSVPAWPRIERAVAPGVTLLYGCGVLAMLGRLVVAVGGGMRLRAVSRVVVDGPTAALVAAQARRLGLAAAPLVAVCEKAVVPVVLGFARPMILLPAAMATGLTPDELAVVLTHELAHLRRCDHWFILAQRVLEAGLFFHPAAWYLSRCIDREREHCCDDLVLGAGADRLVYSMALLHVAELSLGQTPSSALAADGRRPSELRRRVARLLHVVDEPAIKVTRVGALAIALVAALAGVATATLFTADSGDEKRKAVAQVTPPRPAVDDRNEKGKLPGPMRPPKPVEGIARPAVTGRVLDAAGHPIPFALVGIAEKDHYKFQIPLEATIGGALADAEGRFTLPAVEPGEYDIVSWPEVELKGDIKLPAGAVGLVERVPSRKGVTRLRRTVTAAFPIAHVRTELAARAPEVTLRAVPHATFTARFVDSAGEPAPARPARYPIFGTLDGEDWTSVFQPVAGKADTMFALVPKELKEVRIEDDSDNVWWTWAPNTRRVSPAGIRLPAIGGDRPEIVAQRFKSNVLEIRLRTAGGALPGNPHVWVAYRTRTTDEGRRTPERIADGVYRLADMVLPGRDCEVVVGADGFKTALTKRFQFAEEGQFGVVEVLLTPGESDRTRSWDHEVAQDIVLRTADGQPITPPAPPKVADRAIACRVVDQNTGRPVAGAAVTSLFDEVGEGGWRFPGALLTRETRTDADGRFTLLISEEFFFDLHAQPPRDVRVAVRHPGYVSGGGIASLREIAEKGISDEFPPFRVVSLRPARTLTGRVLNPNGEPIANAYVFKERDESETFDPDIHVQTDADGRFQAKIPAGVAFALNVRPPNLAPISRMVAAEETELGDIRAWPRITIKGRVLDASGLPVPWAMVSIPETVSKNKNEAVITTSHLWTADAEGRFETDPLAPGEYVLEINSTNPAHEGNEPVTAFELVPGVYLPRRVTVREGEPVPDITLRAVPHVTFTAALDRAPAPPKNPPADDDPTDTAEELEEREMHLIADLAFFQVRGKLNGVDWVSRFDLPDNPDPKGKVIILVPLGLTDAVLDFRSTAQQFQMETDAPWLIGPEFRLGRVDRSLPNIRLRRYRDTVLRVELEGNQAPEGLDIQAHYVREPEMRAAGVLFDTPAPKLFRTGGRLHAYLVPDEEVVLTARATGAETAPVRVKLREGATEIVRLRLSPELKPAAAAPSPAKPTSPVHWIHMKSDTDGETWANLDDGREFRTDGKQVSLLHTAAHDLFTYKGHGPIVKTKADWYADIVDKAGRHIPPSAFDVNGPDDMDRPKKTADEQRKAANVFTDYILETIDGHPYFRIDQYIRDALGEARLDNQTWYDRVTRRAVRTRRRLQVALQHRYMREFETTLYDYPETGPADLAALGVPRDAAIVDREAKEPSWKWADLPPGVRDALKAQAEAVRRFPRNVRALTAEDNQLELEYWSASRKFLDLWCEAKTSDSQFDLDDKQPRHFRADNQEYAGRPKELELVMRTGQAADLPVDRVVSWFPFDRSVNINLCDGRRTYNLTRLYAAKDKPRRTRVHILSGGFDSFPHLVEEQWPLLGWNRQYATPAPPDADTPAGMLVIKVHQPDPEFRCVFTLDPAHDFIAVRQVEWSKDGDDWHFSDKRAVRFKQLPGGSLYVSAWEKLAGFGGNPDQPANRGEIHRYVQLIDVTPLPPDGFPNEIFNGEKLVEDARKGGAIIEVDQ